MSEKKKKSGRPKNCGRCYKIKTKCNCGRPTVMTEEVILKLEQAFSMDCTDDEACLFAGITKTPFYEYQKANPEFADRKRLLKQKPILLARTELIKGIRDNPELALKYLERKLKSEFSTQQNVNMSGGVSIERKSELERKESELESIGDDELYKELAEATTH